MDIAKFLDQPIRFNPRRPYALSISVSGSRPPSPSCESATSTPSLTSTSSSDFNASLSSENCFSRTQNPIPTPLRISFPLADGSVQVSERSKQPSATPDPSSKTVNARQQRGTKGRKDNTKAACSACQRRKSKCDGKRPACSVCVLKERSCEYLTRVGVSSQAAKRERLESYVTILELVRDAAPEDCDRILQDLRVPRTLNKAIETIQRNWILKSGDRAMFQMHT